eukprot:TRINITY_DN472_c0_g1_i11.p1 TRINITY_DN472_c0_g1~~TRINITY_DN472_c0_g1_i11.p1  ORF type:complete len:147 (-),score=3.07 TRINITY_DN472_c0_g1_i11:86-526(-)
MKCASIPKEICSSSSMCVPDCDWLDCSARFDDQKSFQSVFGLCVPYNLSQIVAYLMCETHSVYKKAQEKLPSIVRCPNRSDPATSFSPQTIYLLIGIGIVIALTLFASIFYRFMMKKNKIPPFRPPDCCPSFLFPRPDYNLSLIHI